ncbi:hypothetical protein ABFS83_07G032200 [Erythranthe nasuta]
MEIEVSDYTLDSMPVPLCASGQGLPYAPVDWPNRGDVWTWKVGNKVNPFGYYRHRYLLVPQRLQKSPTRKEWLGSKLAITRYLQSEFPEADVDAFFAMFVWNIPAEKMSVEKGKKNEAKKIAEKKRKRPSSSRAITITKKQPKSETQISTRTRSSARKFVSLAANNATASTDVNSPPADPLQNDQSALACRPHDSKSLADHLAEMSSEEFEIYLNSLDGTLTNSAPKAVDSHVQIDEFKKVRDELTSLLSIGIPSLIASNKLLEVQNLSYKLQSDPHLTKEEHSMLNLIQEIPPASKDLPESEGSSDNIISMKIQYMLCKDKIALLEAEDASALSAIQEIDQEISKLQSRRAKLAKAVAKNQKRITELASTQNQVFDSVAKIADVAAPTASNRVSQRQMKQKGISKRGSDNLAKFAPLNGFSFRR